MSIRDVISFHARTSTFIYTLRIASQVPVRVGVRLCMSNQSTGLLGQTLVPIQAQYQRAISRLIQVSNLGGHCDQDNIHNPFALAHPLPLKPS
jgi:hypothetical protein